MNDLANLVELRTAHDVRHLRVCKHCGVIGDKRHMIKASLGDFYHGRCFIKLYGLKSLLAQPEDMLDSLMLGDIGWKALRAICDAIAARQPEGEG